MADTNTPQTTSAVADVPEELATLIRSMPILEDPVEQAGPGEAVVPPQRHAQPIPAEGAGGVFTQSWFPICLAAAVEQGLIGRQDAVMVLVTGSGLKDVGAAMQAAGQAPVIKPSLSALADLLKLP